MTEHELSAWLALYFTPKIGPKRFVKLLSKDDPSHLIQAPSDALRALGLSDPQIQAFQGGVHASVDACLEWQMAQNRHILTLNDPSYPALLKQISDPPPLLFVDGEVSVLSEPQIAMVGSRHASADGLENARNFAKALVAHELVVTSGLALGIDGYAHDGALTSAGKTIAVLGSGLERVYPRRHQGLAKRIAEQGALVSEFAPTVAPRPEYFPRRNRVISGLSLGVLVVEAAKNSGSLITARLAAEQGREVFAIPSSLGMPNGQGGNHLIQQGAALVMSAQDVLDEIQSLLDWSIEQQGELFSLANEQQQLPFPELLANVGSEATPVDILASRTNIPVQEVMMQLLELELSGHVVAVSGGYIRKGRS